MKTILITGAAGFTGMHACHYFSEKGYRVIGISRKTAEHLKWKTETCDLLEQIQILNVIKKHTPDYCLHLAGLNSVPQSWNKPVTAIESNVMGTLYLLDAIRIAKPDCKTLVISSALSGTNHPYALSKMCQQNLSLAWAELYDLPIIVAKPSNLIGPGRSSGFVSFVAERIVKMEKEKKVEPIVVSHLDNKREFLDVRDAVAAYEVLLAKGTDRSAYEIGSGKMNPLHEILNTFQSYTELNLSVSSVNANPDIQPALMDSSKIEELNWEPHISLPESIFHILSYYRTL